MKPLDLTKTSPRSPREQLVGLVFIPRTIDKMRALLPGGNPGKYHVEGASLALLEGIGVDPCSSKSSLQAPPQTPTLRRGCRSTPTYRSAPESRSAS